ncbi:MAG TPA: ion transporter [Steroidobacteraceae bacterium]|nr:ion transporter [Steroidobacteraceae bacterium]
MLKLIRTISANEHFPDTILVLLVVLAMTMGAEATPAMAADHGDAIATILTILQVAFVIEILIRVLAYLPRPQDYFGRFWNSFDFIVVALSLVPAIGGLGLLARLLRLTRLVRFVSVSGALRSFSSGRTHGAAALIAGLMMLGLLWYVMALAGFYLFAAASAGHWGSLASGLTNVGKLLAIQPVPLVFSGIGAPLSRCYQAVLYLAELAIFIEVVSHLLRPPLPARGTVP